MAARFAGVSMIDGTLSRVPSAIALTYEDLCRDGFAEVWLYPSGRVS